MNEMNAAQQVKVSPRNFPWLLREAARTDISLDMRYTLRSAADMLSVAIDRLAANPTHDNMIDVNGCWAYAEKVLKLHQTPESTPPQSGQGEVKAFVQTQLSQRRAA